MAEQNGKRARPKRRPLRYFFLDVNVDGGVKSLLHKSLHINRGTDTITAWCYPLGKRVAYTYSHVKKHKETAYTTAEVSKMLNRGRDTLEWAIIRGNVPEPQYTYGIDEHRRRYQYLWNEEAIMAAHAYFKTVHRGRPRLDGKITPALMPTERELRAMIRQEEMLYIKDEDGEFRPVWKAQDFS